MIFYCLSNVEMRNASHFFFPHWQEAFWKTQIMKIKLVKTLTALISLIMINSVSAQFEPGEDGLQTNLLSWPLYTKYHTHVSGPVLKKRIWFEDVLLQKDTFYRFASEEVFPENFIQRSTNPLEGDFFGDFQRMPSGTYNIQWSEDLAEWKNIVTFITTSVSAERTDTLQNGDPLIAGIDYFPVIEFSIHNGESEGIEVNSVTATALGRATGTPNEMLSSFTAGLFLDGIQQGLAKNLSVHGEAVFNDISVIIPSGGTKHFVLLFDTVESISDGVGPNTFGIDIIGIDGFGVETGGFFTTANLPVRGADFSVLKSGSMFVEGISLPPSSIGLGQTVEVWRGRFSALNDSVEISDIYLENLGDIAGDLYEFELRGPNGQLLQIRSMVTEKIHWDLPNQSRIFVPKAGSVDISVFARRLNVPGFANIQLQLETELEENGFEGFSFSTGRPLEGDALNALAEPATGSTFTTP